jgi:hypothetical protein
VLTNRNGRTTPSTGTNNVYITLYPLKATFRHNWIANVECMSCDESKAMGSMWNNLPLGIT